VAREDVAFNGGGKEKCASISAKEEYTLSPGNENRKRRRGGEIEISTWKRGSLLAINASRTGARAEKGPERSSSAKRREKKKRRGPRTASSPQRKGRGETKGGGGKPSRIAISRWPAITAQRGGGGREDRARHRAGGKKGKNRMISGCRTRRKFNPFSGKKERGRGKELKRNFGKGATRTSMFRQ